MLNPINTSTTNTTPRKTVGVLHWIIWISRRGARRLRLDDPAAAKHARPISFVKYAGLTGRHGIFAGKQLDDRGARVSRQYAGGRGRARGTHLDEAIHRGSFRFAQPIHAGEPHTPCTERISRPDHYALRSRIELDHEERLAIAGKAQSLALTDSEVDDTRMLPDNAALEVDDIPGLNGIRLQPLDDLAVAALGHETDVLRVGLVGNAKIEL